MEKLEVALFVPNGVRRRIAVLHEDGIYRLVAAEQIGPGEIVFSTEGDETDRPSMYSVQIDEGLHIDMPPGTDLDEASDRFPWRFLNHSCDPNVRLRGRDWVALRPIQEGDEVTFDYDTTEYHMASPFACRCGAATCRGHIGGFTRLSRAEQLRLLPLLAPHLRRLAEGANA